MSLDPELADAPEHPDAIAWEIRHCARRLESLAELAWEISPPKAQLLTDSKLQQAAIHACGAANLIDGGGS